MRWSLRVTAGEPVPCASQVPSLRHNVFTSSAAFIDTIIEPPDEVWMPKDAVAGKPMLTLPDKEAGVSPIPHQTAEVSKKPSPYAFRFDGVGWHLRFPGDYGDKECPFKDTKGLRFYAKLLANKGKPVTADNLYGIDKERVGGNLPPEKAVTRAGLEAAQRARDILVEKVRDAKKKRDRGEVDQDEVEPLLEKLKVLQDAIEKDFDPKTGRIRNIKDKRTARPPRAAERVMRDALLVLNTKMPKLMIYLQRNCKKITQNTWQYESVDNIEWEF